MENKIENKAAIIVDVNRQSSPSGDSLITTSTQHFYSDGTICKEETKQTINIDNTKNIITTKSIIVNNKDFSMLLLLIVLLALIVTMSSGPAAAFLVEMFPLKIRYTSMSFPYHIGYGIFGGMSPVIITYLIGKTKESHSSEFYLAGLNYPIVLMSIAFVIGMVYLKDIKNGKPGLISDFTRSNKIK